jgi:hypothetical protein
VPEEGYRTDLTIEITGKIEDVGFQKCRTVIGDRRAVTVAWLAIVIRSVGAAEPLVLDAGFQLRFV